MNSLTRKIVLLMLMIATVPVMGQQMIAISGVVRDEGSNPVPFHQVFMTANDSLLTRTFVTDESGFFRDSLVSGGVWITFLHFYTFDCVGSMHDTLVTSLNQMVFVEFYICTDTVPVGCSADFIYVLDSLSFEPNTYRFTDHSTGSIDEWAWDFGDGSYSNEQNPVHQYADSGQYQVCLTAGSSGHPIQCTDTYCEILSTPEYFNFGGLIWAGEYPLNNPINQYDTGKVYLYRLYQGKLWFMGSRQFQENGYYWFAELVEGEYMLKVGLTGNSGNYSNYIPTYFGDQVSWEAAQMISLHSDQFENEVHLVPVAELASGTGVIYGYITWEGFDPSGTGQQPTIILSDENNQPVRYAWPNPNGAYEFSSLPFGSYFVRADLAGRPSVPQPVDLTASSPTVSMVELIVYESAYYAVEETPPEPLSISRIYPNPVCEFLTLEILSEKNCPVTLSVGDMAGRMYINRVIQTVKGSNKLRLDVSAFPRGVYIARISTSSFTGTTAMKFVK